MIGLRGLLLHESALSDGSRRLALLLTKRRKRRNTVLTCAAGGGLAIAAVSAGLFFLGPAGWIAAAGGLFKLGMAAGATVAGGTTGYQGIKRLIEGPKMEQRKTIPSPHARLLTLTCGGL